MASHNELGSQRREPRQFRPSELASWGAATGLVTALPVAALMGYQGMLDDRGLGVIPQWGVFIGYATAVGVAIGLIVAYRPGGLAVAASGGVLIGLLGWLVFALTLDPVLHGQTPTWSAPAAAAAYGVLVADVLHGALTGAAVHGLLALRARRLGSKGPRPASAPAEAEPQTRVVIVGGGFAGLSAARRFERLALRGAPIDVTLIANSNFLLFTPMLAEVASSALEPSHISAPIRAAVPHTRFVYGTVADIDTDDRTVRLSTGTAATSEAERIGYDHLVLAVGSVPHFLDLPGVAEHALTLKDLDDATLLRNHVIGLLEQADHTTTDPEQRRNLLTFVVAGGGFAGSETIAELFDLVHRVLHYFPGIVPTEPRFVLVHSRDRILPELSAELGAYALDRLRSRGIEFRLDVRVVEATATDVLLTDGDRVPTRTFVWTAGNRPCSLVVKLGGEHARNGAPITDPTLRVTGLDRVWAIGDCAQIPDLARDGAPFPPTAQHALRQGTVVADNIVAVIAGRPPMEFGFRAIGLLVALGHRTAAAEIRGRRFSGVAAWLLWRGIYLAKLPGVEKRLRVLLDWVLDLAFPRDIVVTTRQQPTESATTSRQARTEQVQAEQARDRQPR